MNDRLYKFGKRIAELRTKRKLTQEQLAELIDYSTNHISKLELARTNPSFSIIVKIADALKVNMKDLFDFNEDNSNNEKLIQKINLMLKDNPNRIKDIYNITIALTKK